MNRELLQSLRYKLQKRYRKLNSTGFEAFQSVLVQFWNFLHSHDVFVGILEGLRCRYPELKEQRAKLNGDNPKPVFFTTEEEQAAFGLLVIRECVEATNTHQPIGFGRLYCRATKHDECVEAFVDHFVEPLYEYVDEQIDDQRAILALLRRYKHKCEWFQRGRLYEIWQDAKRGEEALQPHLYEYLHDQGIDLVLEPRSASGRADLIADQNTKDPLIADTKIFNPEKGKNLSYLARAFHQVYEYTLNFNEPFGYLIIFKTCPEDLKFSLAKSEQGTSYVCHNGKTIFFLLIDIYPHELSASQRPRLSSYELLEAELIRDATASPQRPASFVVDPCSES